MIDLSSTEKKLDFLDDIEASGRYSEETFDLVKDLSMDNDCEIRNRVAQLLALFPISQAEPLLCKMLDDKDDLVRANACDSLSFSFSPRTMEKLKQRVLHDRYIVRGYAALSIADMGNNLNQEEKTADYLQKRLDLERSTWVKICYYRALCLLGKPEYYSNILIELDNRYYTNRILVINTICELVNDENRAATLNALQNRLMIERNFMLSKRIDDLINQLHK